MGTNPPFFFLSSSSSSWAPTQVLLSTSTLHPSLFPSIHLSIWWNLIHWKRKVCFYSWLWTHHDSHRCLGSRPFLNCRSSRRCWQADKHLIPTEGVKINQGCADIDGDNLHTQQVTNYIWGLSNKVETKTLRGSISKDVLEGRRFKRQYKKSIRRGEAAIRWQLKRETGFGRWGCSQWTHTHTHTHTHAHTIIKAHSSTPLLMF